MKAVIPVFKSTLPLLTETSDICKYVLDAYIRSPKGINDTFSEREISLQYDLAATTDHSVLTSLVNTNLKKVLDSYFPDTTVETDVKIIDTGVDGISDLSISISVLQDGITYTVTDNLVVEESGNIRIGK